MDIIFVTGVIGSLLLVTGSAWPEKRGENPVRSTKNWLFTFGNLIMLTYALLGYFEGAPIFFLFLEVLVVIATLMMMMSIDDRIDTAVISILGIGFIAWSLYLFEGYNTIFFILGLSGLSLGYAFDNGTLRRSVALTVGSILVALFSYIEASWIFFWLNVFFALFSGYYVLKALQK